MTWRRATNYHGSREYDDDVPGPSGVGQIGLTIAWLLDKVRRPFEALMPASEPRRPAPIPRQSRGPLIATMPMRSEMAAAASDETSVRLDQ